MVTAVEYYSDGFLAEILCFLPQGHWSECSLLYIEDEIIMMSLCNNVLDCSIGHLVSESFTFLQNTCIYNVVHCNEIHAHL